MARRNTAIGHFEVFRKTLYVESLGLKCDSRPHPAVPNPYIGPRYGDDEKAQALSSIDPDIGQWIGSTMTSS